MSEYKFDIENFSFIARDIPGDIPPSRISIRIFTEEGKIIGEVRDITEGKKLAKHYVKAQVKLNNRLDIAHIVRIKYPLAEMSVARTGSIYMRDASGMNIRISDHKPRGYVRNYIQLTVGMSKAMILKLISSAPGGIS